MLPAPVRIVSIAWIFSLSACGSPTDRHDAAAALDAFAEDGGRDSAATDGGNDVGNAAVDAAEHDADPATDATSIDAGTDSAREDAHIDRDAEGSSDASGRDDASTLVDASASVDAFVPADAYSPPDAFIPDAFSPDAFSPCAPVAATDVHYVDPLLGRDDAGHGGGMGSCAYRTLTFALGRAANRIQLAPGIYGSARETLPFVLNGEQEIWGEPGVVLRGVGPYFSLTSHGSRSPTVVLRGSANVVADLALDGARTAGSIGLFFDSPSPSTRPHTVSGCDVTGYIAGLVMLGPNYAGITGNDIHENTVGIEFELDPTASMTLNTISDNIAYDIRCVSFGAPAVSGAGNVFTTCADCSNCSTFDD